jgi:filamentous hemagglutinin
MQIEEGKLDYLFGKATGKGSLDPSHTLTRTNQNALQMKRLGVHDTPEGHEILRRHLQKVIQGDSNIIDLHSDQYGLFEVRESFFIGPSGKSVKFQTSWQVLPGGYRRLVTIIPFGG